MIDNRVFLSFEGWRDAVSRERRAFVDWADAAATAWHSRDVEVEWLKSRCARLQAERDQALGRIANARV